MPTGTIICVDDDSSLLKSIRTLLGSLGPSITVEIAESPHEALQLQQELVEHGQEISVIIADYLMPEMRGDELLIRMHTVSPDAITIMLTGQSDFEGVKQAINHANLYRFLDKPFNNDDFLLTVKAAFLAYSQKGELQRTNSLLKFLNSDLETMLETLRRQQEDLTRSEAKATISTLVASVSHELGTPLGVSLTIASVIGEASTKMEEALRSGLIKRSDFERYVMETRQGADLLLRNMERARGLLKNFMQVSADQASEQRRTFDLATTVQEILATLAPSLRQKPYRVTTEIPKNVPMDSLPGALGQIIINLVNNAYLHAFEGRDTGELRITAEKEKDAVKLCVSDNGSGIGAESLEHIFEPFFSSKIGRGGTGLGLAIVKNLACKSMGGTLNVESSLGVGTTFTLTLPCTLPSAYDAT